MASKMTMVTVTLLLTLTPLLPVGAEILYAETAPMSFEVWAADLAPGFILKESTINDRLCYCKKSGGWSSSSTSSFNFVTIGPLTSSGVPGSSFEYIFLTPPPDEPNQVIFRPTVNASDTTALPAAANSVATARKACGECDIEVTIDDTNFMNIHEWKTPGWDKGENYPDGCTCTFKAHVRLSQYGYFVYDFAAGSNIKALNNCAHDRLEVDLNGNKDTWCDSNMSKFSGGEYTVGVPQDYTFTFISDPSDGNQVEKGFSLTIQAYNFGRKV